MSAPDASMDLVAIGVVSSSLTDPVAAPKQGFEGAPDAWLVLEPGVAAGLDGLRPGDEIIVLTWLHQADRDVLRVHPRDDPANPERGVFTTRSADRPNPIGVVSSPLTDRGEAPKQGFEGAPDAWVVLERASPRASTACGRGTRSSS